MVVPKLPPLPRDRKSKLPRLTKPAPANAAAIPIWKPKLDNEVEVLRDLYGIVMGGTETGRWFETTTADGSIGGQCARCGRLRKAENLALRTLPFGRGEQWECKEGDC